MVKWKVTAKPVSKKTKGSAYVFRLDAYPAYFIIGRRGGGKSVLLERALEWYWENGYVVLDWNSAFDLEALHWCVADEDRRKNGKPTRAYPILVIMPENKELITDGRKIKVKMYDGSIQEVEAVKSVPDTTPLKDIIMQAYRERRVCIFSIYLYAPNIAAGQKKLASYLHVGGLPDVVRDHLPNNIRLALGLRELKDLSSSRMLTHGGTGEKESKRALNFIAAQARHARTVLIVDMQNPDDVNATLTRQEDYTLVKNFSLHHIPDWLKWLQIKIEDRRAQARARYRKSNWVSLNRVGKNSFYCVHPDGEVTLEHNGQPLFRHHRENDDAQALAGIIDIKVNPIKSSKGARIEDAKEREKETQNEINLMQEILEMNRLDGLSYKQIQEKKRVKGQGGELLDPNSLQKKVSRFLERGLIKEPELPKPADEVTSGPEPQPSESQTSGPTSSQNENIDSEKSGPGRKDDRSTESTDNG